MIGAIGLPSFSGTVGTGVSTGVLESQLAQCERQLSDWTHCVSAKTPEGKATIQALSDKVGAIKKRIEEAVNANSTSQSTTPKAKTSIVINTNQDVAAPQRQGNSGVTPAPAIWPEGATMGSLINVFA